MSGEVQQLLRERESGGDERREHRKILSPGTATEAIAIIKPCWHWNRVERRRDTRSNRISQSLNESRCARGTCFKW